MFRIILSCNLNLCSVRADDFKQQGVKRALPRHRKRRRVGHVPMCSLFKPAGIPAYDLEEVVLRIEEMEAIRLKDLVGLDQEACAERMGVSRPTFQRILVEARRKVAEVLIEGKALRIEGGAYHLDPEHLQCPRCQYSLIEKGSVKCPKCEQVLGHYEDNGL